MPKPQDEGFFVDIAPYFGDTDETLTKCPACPAGPGSGAARYEQLGKELWKKTPCVYCEGEGLITASRRDVWLVQHRHSNF